MPYNSDMAAAVAEGSSSSKYDQRISVVDGVRRALESLRMEGYVVTAASIRASARRVFGAESARPT